MAGPGGRGLAAAARRRFRSRVASSARGARAALPDPARRPAAAVGRPARRLLPRLLEGALVDRHISASEADDLIAVAIGSTCPRADVEHLHRGYLAGLAAVALEDGVVTAAERHDLDGVAVLLGLSTAAVDEALAAPAPARDRWQLHVGDLVVFTGATSPPREDWQREAVAAGLTVGDNVTTKTRLLIAADPDSMSGKAKKARQYGVPIVHPVAYQGILAGLGATV